MSFIILLQIAVLLPLCTATVIAGCGRHQEKLISGIASLSSAVLFGNQLLLVAMFSDRADIWEVVLPFLHHHFEFQFRVDSLGVVFSTLTALFGLTIVRFSLGYMHREPGFRRFFVMIFVLVGGMQILSLANSLATFFIGWELIGIASFVLIAFYREQKNSVINALKVFSVYRIGDLGLLFGMLSLHLCGAGSNFSSLGSDLSGFGSGYFLLYLSVGGLILAAMAKSAQFPFSFWLPRAMEGPTPSSAIFYGALSVHAGVLLLARLQPVWQTLPGIPALIVGIGLLTAVLAEGASRTHPSIKGRLAMASVTQVGLIFAELGLGLNVLAIWHTVAHALLRSAQILISPSVISHLLRMKSAGMKAPFLATPSVEKLLSARLRSTLWVLAFQGHLVEHQMTRFYYALRARITRRNIPHIVALLLAFIGMVVVLAPDRSVKFSISLAGIAALLSFTGIIASLTFRTRVTLSVASILLSEVILIRLGSLDGVLAVMMAAITVGLLATVLILGSSGIKASRASGFLGMWIEAPLRSATIFACAALLAGIPPSPLFFIEDIAWSNLIAVSVPFTFALGVIHAMNGIALFKASAYLTMGSPGASASLAKLAETKAVDYKLSGCRA